MEGAGGVNAHQLTGDPVLMMITIMVLLVIVKCQLKPKIVFSGSVFSHWKVARWAQKLRLENRFELQDGKLTVNSPGIYYIYAQVSDISLQPELRNVKCLCQFFLYRFMVIQEIL